MIVITDIGKFEKLYRLIVAGNTGTPGILAKKLAIDKVTLFCMIDELNNLDLNIAYSNKKESYYLIRESHIKQ